MLTSQWRHFGELSTFTFAEASLFVRKRKGQYSLCMCLKLVGFVGHFYLNFGRREYTKGKKIKVNPDGSLDKPMILKKGDKVTVCLAKKKGATGGKLGDYFPKELQK